MSAYSPIPAALAVIHIETTGLNACYGDTITEIGVLRVGAVTNQIQLNSIEAMHATADDSTERIPSEDLMVLANFIGQLPVACFNHDFHRDFIDNEFNKAGVMPPAKWICLLEMARDLMPNAPSHRLMDLTANTSPPDSLSGVTKKAYRSLLLYGALVQQ